MMTVTFNSQKVRVSTGLHLYGEWFKDSNRAKKNADLASTSQTEELNRRLNELERTAQRSFDHLCQQNDGQYPDVNEYRDELFAALGRREKEVRDEFTAFWEDFIQNAHQKKTHTTKDYKPLSVGTIKQYQRTYDILRDYAKARNKVLSFGTLDLKFHSDFLSYLSELELSSAEQGKQIKNIKAICNRAIENGIEVHPHVTLKRFFKPRPDSEDDTPYLNWDEVKLIEKVELPPRLDNARQWFLIGLYTGLRIGDFMRLSMDSVHGENLIVKMQKTKRPVVIPIAPVVRSIIDQNNGFPRRISDQKFNEYTKQICQIAGLDTPTKGTKKIPIEVKGEKVIRGVKGVYPKYELISSHTCRRSFASNYYGKIPTPLIMQITGHQSEKVFLSYIKVTPEEHAEMFRQQAFTGD